MVSAQSQLNPSPPCKTLQGELGFPSVYLFWYYLIRQCDKQTLIRNKETEQQKTHQEYACTSLAMYPLLGFAVCLEQSVVPMKKHNGFLHQIQNLRLIWVLDLALGNFSHQL